jgi:hypothetical protein
MKVNPQRLRLFGPATLSLALGILFHATSLEAADLVHAKDGSGFYGYTDTPVLPWSGYKVHDPNRPAPPRIKVASAPQQPAPPPSDAVVLFDGSDLAKWQPHSWKLVDGCIEAGAGNLVSRESFGDCQIHIEWMMPADFEGPWYDQGNNGVMLMGLYEIQIFDSYNEKIYPDGAAAAIYGQTPPLVNATLPPGQWQSFDIVFTAPVFEGDKLARPARVTMFHNGVLVHLDEEIRGETRHRALPAYTRKISQGPLMLLGHNCPVRFRNIWVRPLAR